MCGLSIFNPINIYVNTSVNQMLDPDSYIYILYIFSHLKQFHLSVEK